MAYGLDRLVAALPELVWTALPDGRLDFVNQRWCEYTGLSADDAYRRGWEAGAHPEDLPELLKQWHSILSTGAPREMEARLRRFDGTYRWFLCRTCPLTDEAGQVVKWCGTNTDIDDFERVGEAPSARLNRYRSIADSIPALIAFMRPTGEVEFVNRHVEEYFGATLEVMKRWTTGDSVHPDDLPMVSASWMQSVKTEEPFEIDQRLRRRDGVYRWFRVQGLPLRGTEGRVAGWYVLQTDIHERKRAEALLTGEKRLLELVARGESIAVILAALCVLVEETVEGCYCGVALIHPSTTRLEHAAGPRLSARFIAATEGQPLDLDSGPCAMAVHLNEQVIAADLTAETRWAASAWCSTALAHELQACWATPIRSATATVLGALVLYYDVPKAPADIHQGLIQQFTNITSIAIERRQSEERLRRSEAFLAQAQRLSSMGSFSWIVATGQISWSDQLYRIFEFESTLPVTLELIFSRVHPQDLPSAYETLARLRSNARDFEFEFRLLMPDGSVKCLNMVAHGFGDREDQLEYIGAIQDITERRCSEDALGKVRSELAHVARNASLGVLTASIAHEVNQPLSGIITNADTCLRMLDADPPNIDGARMTARRAIRDGHRASEVIARLRALFGKKEATAELVDLNEATREVIALSLSELQRSRVILRTELTDDLAPVTGDRVQLQQVILNLLLNATEAMSRVDDRPRQVVIKTEPDGRNRLRLAVQDAGVGLDPQHMDRIFEAFYTTKSDGMGIGLSVSRSIIESHQGRLWAEPNAGPGATFAFSLPRGTQPRSDS